MEGLNDLARREKEVNEKELANEREKTALAQGATELEKKRGDLYEQLFRDVTKRNGWGCFFKRLFTFGRASCI